MFESLKNTKQFDYVYKNGKSFANKYLIMYYIRNETNRNKYGISVSKRVGNSVVRHRVARLIRESCRLEGEKFNSGLDIVIIARQGAKGKNYFDIKSAFLHLGKLHGILKSE